MHTDTNITDIVVTPRTAAIIGQITAIGKDHKTFKIVHTTDHTIALTIDHTIIHKTDHRIDNNTNISLKSMKSDCEDYCTEHDTQEAEDPKN